MGEGRAHLRQLWENLSPFLTFITYKEPTRNKACKYWTSRGLEGERRCGHANSSSLPGGFPPGASPSRDPTSSVVQSLLCFTLHASSSDTSGSSPFASPATILQTGLWVHLGPSEPFRCLRINLGDPAPGPPSLCVCVWLQAPSRFPHGQHFRPVCVVMFSSPGTSLASAWYPADEQEKLL